MKMTVVEWFTLLLCIWDVLASNLGSKAVYPEGVRGFPQSLHIVIVP
jgi:hypothetical protein